VPGPRVQPSSTDRRGPARCGRGAAASLRVREVRRRRTFRVHGGTSKVLALPANVPRRLAAGRAIGAPGKHPEASERSGPQRCDKQGAPDSTAREFQYVEATHGSNREQQHDSGHHPAQQDDPPLGRRHRQQGQHTEAESEGDEGRRSALLGEGKAGDAGQVVRRECRGGH